MLVGSDETNYKAVEAAIGHKVDVIRAYRYKGQNHKSLAQLAAQGYLVQASYKFRDGNGTVHATDVSNGVLDSDLDVFDETMETLVKVPQGPHEKCYEHEEEAKAAAASGTPDQLNAALAHCFGRRKAQAVAAGLLGAVCWTGWDLLTREIPFRASGKLADRIWLDPYELAPNGPWASLVASYGQDFLYLSKVYPGVKVALGEVNAPNTAGPGMQAAWMNQGRHDLEAQFGTQVYSACIWQGQGNLTETPAELALMKNGFFAPGTPISTGTTVTPAQLSALKTAQTNYDAARAAYTAALAAYGTAHTTLDAATAAYENAADALELATKAVTG